MMRRRTILSVLLVISLFTAISCSTPISQENIDKINEELSEAQSQLQEKVAEAAKLKAANEALQNQFDDVKSENKSLQEQYDAVKSETGASQETDELKEQLDVSEGKYNSLEADYEKLNSEYQDLRASYKAITEAPDTAYSEQDVEQQIFQAVNEARTNNGLDELKWGTNLYKWARANSQDMAAKQDLVYSSYGAFQELYRAVGYDTAEKFTEALMTIWENGNQYDRKFLNSGTAYGAVAVYKSGEIYYITYIADYFS